MNTDQATAAKPRTKTQLVIDTELMNELNTIMLPPYVGVSLADRAEYAIHEFIRSRKPADQTQSR